MIFLKEMINRLEKNDLRELKKCNEIRIKLIYSVTDF